MGQLLINYMGTKNDVLNHVNDTCNASNLIGKERMNDTIVGAVNAIEGEKVRVHVTASSEGGFNMSVLPVV